MSVVMPERVNGTRAWSPTGRFWAIEMPDFELMLNPDDPSDYLWFLSEEECNAYIDRMDVVIR